MLYGKIEVRILIQLFMYKLSVYPRQLESGKQSHLDNHERLSLLFLEQALIDLGVS